MHPIAFFYPEGHEAHYRWGHAERPERVEAIKHALIERGIWQSGPQLSPEPIPDEVMDAIHSRSLLDSVHHHSENDQDYDLDTYVTRASWQLALNAAGGAAAVARMVWRRDAAVGFALTRPPGHHATRDRAMGFCLLNNVALAAEVLLRTENAQRLAIVDMDVHHGNGTQDIFWERGDVLFISTHQSPLYPGTGMLDERGANEGEGATVNLPLPPFSGDQAFQVAYQEMIPAMLERFQPEMILVSFGFDSHWRDPLANLQVSARGYGDAMSSLKRWAEEHCGGRLAVILEGGYDLEAASACGLAAAQALLGMQISDAIGPAPQAESDDWVPVLEEAKETWKL